MMRLAEYRALIERFERAHTVTMAAIGLLDDGALDFRPTAKLRTARALLFHMFAVEKGIAEAVQSGELSPDTARWFTPEDPAGAAAAAKLETAASLVLFGEQCHSDAAAALTLITELQLSRTIRSPYRDYSGSEFIGFMVDEHWHHRGQFYVYLRLLGKKPPSIYGDDNDST